METVPSYFQILKIESDEIVIDEDQTSLLKVDYWKDMISEERNREHGIELAEKKYKKKYSALSQKEKSDFNSYMKDVREAIKLYEYKDKDGKTHTKKYPHAFLGQKAASNKKESDETDFLTTTQLRNFKKLKIQESKEAKEHGKRLLADTKPSKKPKKTLIGKPNFMDSGMPKTKKETKVKIPIPKVNFKGISVDKLEQQMNSHKFSKLTDDELSEQITKVSKKIDTKFGKRNLSNTAQKKYNKMLVSERKMKEETHSFPSVPTMEDAKRVAGKGKIQQKFKKLKDEYKKNFSLIYTKRKKLNLLRRKISKFEARHTLGTGSQNIRGASKLQGWFRRKASLLELIALRQQVAFLKTRNITDKISDPKPKAKLNRIPDSLYEYVFKVLNKEDMQHLMSIIQKLNEIHKESQGKVGDYTELFKAEIPFNGQGEEAIEKHFVRLSEKLKTYFDSITSTTNDVIADMNENMNNLREELSTFEGIEMDEETIISATEILNAPYLAEIGEKEKTVESLNDTKRLFTTIIGEAQSYYSKLPYDIATPRTKQSTDALLFTLITEDVAGVSSEATFDELETKNYFLPKNLYKIAKIIKILESSPSNKQINIAKKMPNKNRVSNHSKVVDVLSKKYAGKFGYKVFSNLMEEKGMSLPSVHTQDTTFKILRRSKTVNSLIVELEKIDKIFETPDITDDLEFLQNPKYIQRMLDLAERNYLNTKLDIEEDSHPETTLEVKRERLSQAKNKFARLAYVALFMNNKTHGTTFLEEVGGRLIVSNKILNEINIPYSKLNEEYGDTLSIEVKREIKRIIADAVAKKKAAAKIKETKVEVEQ